MIVVQNNSQLLELRLNWKEKSVGFVPTMGALHQGHAELLKKSVAENEITVLSIFVNPTQFNSSDDLKKYPKTLSADESLAQQVGADILWLPDYSQLYPDNYRFKVTETEFSKILCGAHRPGHFDGVLSIVMKLLNLVKPNRAYFGEKDYQQYQLVKDMAQAYFLETEIVGVPTIRETSGLALSSRNLRLSPEELKQAPLLFKTLKESPSAGVAAKKLTELGFKVDYVEDIRDRRFAAAFLGDVRLIDNVQI